MKDLFLIVFGFVELIVRMVLLLILVLSLVGLMYLALSETDIDEIVNPILWRKIK